MKNTRLLVVSLCLLVSINLYSQEVKLDQSRFQVRRNHSIQYFSFPDYKFDRLRKESLEKYESYADMGLNEWIKLKIEVKGKQAKLFINDNKQPSLIVNDLKLGDNSSGAVGLYVDNGTEGYFMDLGIR